MDAALVSPLRLELQVCEVEHVVSTFHGTHDLGDLPLDGIGARGPRTRTRRADSHQADRRGPELCLLRQRAHQIQVEISSRFR